MNMNYKFINTGDVLLVSSKPKKKVRKFLVNAIQKITNCKWNHAGLFVWVENKLYISESNEKGVCFTNFKHYLERDCELLLLSPKRKFTHEVKNIITHYTIDVTGDIYYDYANLLFHQLVRWISIRLLKKDKWIGKKKNTCKKMTCSEWVAHIHKIFNNSKIKDYKLAPKDLYEAKDIFSSAYIRDGDMWIKYDNY